MSAELPRMCNLSPRTIWYTSRLSVGCSGSAVFLASASATRARSSTSGLNKIRPTGFWTSRSKVRRKVRTGASRQGEMWAIALPLIEWQDPSYRPAIGGRMAGVDE